MIQLRLHAEVRNGTIRVNIPAAVIRKYWKSTKGKEELPKNLVAFFALPETQSEFDAIHKKVEKGEKPIPIILNIVKSSTFY